MTPTCAKCGHKFPGKPCRFCKHAQEVKGTKARSTRRSYKHGRRGVKR